MKVFKFGGASVNNVERIKNLAAILQQEKDPLVVIISAMGKTTNALEKVAETFYEGKKEEALGLFETVKQHHITTAKYLLVTGFNACLAQLTDFFTEIEWLLHDKPVREYDYYYDQIVCVGELLSTCIISHYLNEAGTANEWLDVRDLVRTDNNFRDAGIDWPVTSERITGTIRNDRMYLTQGFIGSTDDNESTTLGREGSDYTAAIFAHILDAGSLTIWKDVEGVMNADPKLFPSAQLITELSFTEVIEMAYYGAQVIHPKTIKPLQNKKIPLFVKCFLDPSLSGTVIHHKNSKTLPPIIVIKENQALLHLHSKDFSFVGEQLMSRLYELFAKVKIKPNLIQSGAISVQVCLDDRSDKVNQLATEASQVFDVNLEKQLSLLTIRHYNTEVFESLTKDKEIVLSQRTKETVQALYR
ncbi:aspartate kinase [Sediminibacterium soli]|uniref:aspartate kinase n=1 Tax=Sediminibacterium soli TaxID=2698829 RepID=UPI00137950D3|nr:aspartate kinase [Sediminibacterium soli]NCI46027.1 aspartate kinase [Sediminibacterium soli]